MTIGDAGPWMKGWTVVFAVILAPSAVRAQDTLRSWRGLDVSELSTVYVLDETGTETEGRLLRLDPDALVLVVDGAEQRFAAARVRRIDRRGDSLRNGALIGAIAGTVMGLVGAGISDCPGSNAGGGCWGARTAIFFVSVGMYAAIGTGIDALVSGRTTVYVAPSAPPAAARDRSVRPATAPGPSINLRVSW